MKQFNKDSREINKKLKETNEKLRQLDQKIKEINKKISAQKKIKAIKCTRCEKTHSYLSKKCTTCNSNLKYLCVCGVWRSYSNLTSHDCDKIKRRSELKKKFRTENRNKKRKLNEMIMNDRMNEMKELKKNKKKKIQTNIPKQKPKLRGFTLKEIHNSSFITNYNRPTVK